MASAGVASGVAPAPGPPAPPAAGPDLAGPPGPPAPARNGLTRLCPGCGVRRPLFHFIRRNARSMSALTLNCATCRGFQPVDPAKGGNADGNANGNADGGAGGGDDGNNDADYHDDGGGGGGGDDDDDVDVVDDDYAYDDGVRSAADAARGNSQRGRRASRRSTGRGTQGANSGNPDDDSDDSDHSRGSGDDDRRRRAGMPGLRHRHRGRRGHAGGDQVQLRDLVRLRDQAHLRDQVQLRDESEWILTGLGVVLYFFGWFSIVALFVVIISF